jgi:hypothetical protein
MQPTELLAGTRFGKLTVIQRGENTVEGKTRYWCECDCGELTLVWTANLRRGNTVSCGCHRASIRGLSRTMAYRAWYTMIRRTSPDNEQDRKDYFDRGITVCERWLSFENFYADMGDRPDGMSMDRIDNDNGYEPGNCQWATAGQQARNRRAPTR